MEKLRISEAEEEEEGGAAAAAAPQPMFEASPEFTVEAPAVYRIKPRLPRSVEDKHLTQSYSMEHMLERWYRDFFARKDHQNYVGTHPAHGPLVLSILRERIHVAGEKKKKRQYRAIVWTQQGMLRCLVPRVPGKDIFGTLAKQCGWEANALSVLVFVGKQHRPKLVEELLRFEDTEVTNKLVLGVVSGEPGQATLQQMLGNEHATREFETFMEFLGTKVKIKDWEKPDLVRLASLDFQKHDGADTFTYWTRFLGFEIVFHVSTLLAYSATDPQQVERKRKIGNDVAVIVFKTGDTPLSLADVSSKVNHVIGCVSPTGTTAAPAAGPGGVSYRFGVATKHVGEFGPALNDETYDDVSDFRTLLLTKMINGSKVAYRNAPGFHVVKTRVLLLTDLVKRFTQRTSLVSRVIETRRRKSVLIPPAQLKALRSGLCGGCGKPITVAETGVCAINQNWHIEHFVCYRCKEPFGSNPFILNKKDEHTYCERDYLELFCPVCAECNEHITDYVVQACGKTWHMIHFSCDNCGQPLGEETYMEKEGTAFCHPCYYEVYGNTCEKCSTIIEGKHIEAMGRFFHEACYVCGGCGRIAEGECITAVGQPWHADCFKCKRVAHANEGGGECGAQLDAAEVYEFGGKPFCKLHYYQAHNMICVACKEPVLAGTKAINVSNRTYHAECFTCSACDTKLTSTFVEQNGAVLCQNCHTGGSPA